MRRLSFLVMAGLVPAIHVVLFGNSKDVDARHICAKTRFALQAGHDDLETLALIHLP
jgi:hypothetical protein